MKKCYYYLFVVFLFILSCSDPKVESRLSENKIDSFEKELEIANKLDEVNRKIDAFHQTTTNKKSENIEELVKGEVPQFGMSASKLRNVIKNPRNLTRGDNLKKWGFLISVNEFKKVGNKAPRTLKGPVADMDGLGETLINKFHFPSTNILRLHGLAATRQNIIDGFNKIIEVTKDIGEDFVVAVGISSHGSQTPDVAYNEHYEEADQEDETICTYDREENGDLIDDELHYYLTKILQNSHAHIHLLVDACHSGTVFKSTEFEEDGDFIYKTAEPSDVIVDVSYVGEGTEVIGSFSDPNYRKRFVSLAAALDQETAKEKTFYLDPKGRHGVFSHALANALKDVSPEFTAWEDLENRLNSLISVNSNTQSLQMLGNKYLRIFGTEEITDKPHFKVMQVLADGKIVIKGGNVHGITKKTIISIHPQGQGIALDNIQATYEVIEVKTDIATAKVKEIKNGYVIQAEDNIVIRIPGGTFKPHLLTFVNLPLTLENLLKSFVQEDSRFTLDSLGEKNEREFRITKTKGSQYAIHGGPYIFVTKELTLAGKAQEIVDWLTVISAWYRVLSIENNAPSASKLQVDLTLTRHDPNGASLEHIKEGKILAFQEGNRVHIKYENKSDKNPQTFVYINILFLNYEGKIYLLNPESTVATLNTPVQLLIPGTNEPNYIGVTVPKYEVTLLNGNSRQIQHQVMEYFKIFITEKPFDASRFEQGHKDPNMGDYWDIENWLQAGDEKSEPAGVNTKIYNWNTLTVPILCVPKK